MSSMQNIAATHVKRPSNPLDQLSEILSDDMKKVNALIIDYMQSDVPLIPQLAKYLIAAGGKRIRPLLTLGAAQIFEADMNKAYYLASAVEFIHSATLLHDDVVDESHERRGQKSANVIFGNQASVLVGDFLFSKSFQMMVEAGSLDILRILSNASAIIAQGEVLQLSTANNINTTMSEYMRVIESKTAALFAAACEIGPVLAGVDSKKQIAMRDYGMNLGIAFQIVDDILDYAADPKVLGKDIGDDFKEGKITAPILFALTDATDDEKAFWQRTLGEKQQNPDDFDIALNIIYKHQGIEKSQAMALDYANAAKNGLSLIPHSVTKQILCDLADYTISRCY